MEGDCRTEIKNWNGREENDKEVEQSWETNMFASKKNKIKTILKPIKNQN